VRDFLHGNTSFFMEAHDGLSAKIVEKAGFQGVWASSLALSSVLGKRDANEASWSELIDVAGRMAGVTHLPVLLDGDNALGEFNTMRQIVTNCCHRNIAGVAVEDKAFPKRNSLRDGDSVLLPTKTFQGIIRAGKDSQTNTDFMVIARTEALVAGCPVQEALDRAVSYAEAGADAILVHSRNTTGDDILAFLGEWTLPVPVVLVPTTYYKVSTHRLVDAGANVIIWGNHLLRAAMSAMTRVAYQVRSDCSVAEVEGCIARVDELFELMKYDELDDATELYT
jgi:phosphoenolpyruvate phosphomutase